MPVPRAILLCLLAGVLILGACSTSSTPADPTSTPAPANPVEGTAAPAPGPTEAGAGEGEVFDDPDEPIAVTTGEAFALSVPANPSTGYEWALTTPPDPAMLRSTGHRYTPDPDAEGATGVGGTDLWTFTAVGPGQTSLTLTYARPSAPTADATTTTFHVGMS